MRKKQNVIAIVLEWMLALAVGSLMAFLVLRNLLGDNRPLTNADIPQTTIDWFNGLWNDTTDIGGILGPDDRDTSDWNRYEDIDNMSRLEDEYFVIYYSKHDSVNESNKALVCQRYAHEAIPKGELFMKNYPYPNQLNGRKLPIYLANTVNDFRNICKQLGHGDPGTWAIGLYCFQYGVHGVYTDGIIISPEAWSISDSKIEAATSDEELKQTLWHEMNHFMYFTNWDYVQTSEPSLWFTEGLAEYFAESYGRLREVGNYNRLSLTKDFRGGGNTEYWAGLSAFLCLEQNFQRSQVADVVVNSYKNSIDESLKTVIPNYSLEEWDKQWHVFMENKEYRKYMP